MTATELNHLAAELKTATLEVRGATEQAKITGMVHEYAAGGVEA